MSLITRMIVSLLVASLYLSGCQSVEQIKVVPELQCHRCYISACDDPSFCNSTTEFIRYLHKDLIRSTDRPCPEEIANWKNPNFTESCHNKGFCGKRTFKVTAINYLSSGDNRTTRSAPTGVQEANTSTPFPILKPPHSTHESHEYEFVLFSCTKPETDCNKTAYSNSKYSVTVNAATNKTMEFGAELSEEPKTCAKCQQNLCNQASASELHTVQNPPSIVSATSKFYASMVNIVILLVSFLAIHYCCDSMV